MLKTMTFKTTTSVVIVNFNIIFLIANCPQKGHFQQKKITFTMTFEQDNFAVSQTAHLLLNMFSRMFLTQYFINSVGYKSYLIYVGQ